MKQCQEELMRKKNSIIQNLQRTEKSLLDEVNTNPRLWNRECFEFKLTSKVDLVLKADLKIQDRAEKKRIADEGIFKALFNCIADDDDELSFEEGDEIAKLSEPDSEGEIEVYINHVTIIISRVGRR